MSLHCRSIIQHNLLSNAVYGSSSHRDIAIKSTMLLLTVAQSLIFADPRAPRNTNHANRDLYDKYTR